MTNSKLEELTEKELKEKEKGLKVLMIVFIPLVLGIFYFVFKDYFNAKEMDFAMLTVAICTLGGPAVLYPQLKEVKRELKNRS